MSSVKFMYKIANFFLDICNLKNKKSAFTIVELLVVISIIGLLSMIIFDGLQESKLKSKDATIKSNLITLRNVGALFFDNNQKYTDTLVDINCTTPIVQGSVYPSESARNKGVFFADEPGWSALHNSIALSSDPFDSQCVIGTNGYIIAIRLATGGVSGDSKPDTICIDHQGSMTLRPLAIGENITNSINYTTSRCAN